MEAVYFGIKGQKAQVDDRLCWSTADGLIHREAVDSTRHSNDRLLHDKAMLMRMVTH